MIPFLEKGGLDLLVVLLQLVKSLMHLVDFNRETLRTWWDGVSMEGTESYVLMKKLKVQKGLLKNWNMEVFGNLTVNKNEAFRLVSHWDLVENSSRLTLVEMERRQEARDNYRNWDALEEISCRQKSREVWVKEGDRNTRFFHKMAS